MNLRRSSSLAVLAGALAVASVSFVAAADSGSSNQAKTQQQSQEKSNVPGVLNFTMPSLGGDPVDLSRYQGKVLMIVNTASKCGNTPQYKDLEALYEKYKDQGFEVLGFPANDFKEQEPGTNADIAEFCTKNYGVTFPMFSKVHVKGDEKAPLYHFLTEEKTNSKFPGEITWNFEKFIISRDGQIAARFHPGVKPSTPEVVNAIESELQKK